MSEEERISEILSTTRKIEESEQPVSVYFNQNSVPFSLAQYGYVSIYKDHHQKASSNTKCWYSF